MGRCLLRLYQESSTDCKSRLVVKKLGLDAERESSQKKVLDVKFEPKGDISLDKPKFGKVDEKNAPHSGGNTWSGGVRGSTVSVTLSADVFADGWKRYGRVRRSWRIHAPL